MQEKLPLIKKIRQRCWPHNLPTSPRRQVLAKQDPSERKTWGKRVLREMPGGLNYRARGKTISPSADHHRVSNIGKRWNSFLSTVGQL